MLNFLKVSNNKIIRASFIKQLFIIKINNKLKPNRTKFILYFLKSNKIHDKE